ncbi:MAG: DUF2254 domain-containing protein [Clostridiales bacterium]|nr:DUF2254 domain-containing protein [Clostridiales bacterium]MDY3061876.1 DUF2254 family protein [Eubacteriales bacterium]
MISNLRLWLINHKNVVKMSRFSLLTLLLLLISWFFDHQFVELKSIIPDSLLLPLDVSLTFLSNISGVFPTISIFALTTIITVLNKYSSSVTPRMAQDFIDRADVLTLHGIFVGGASSASLCCRMWKAAKELSQELWGLFTPSFP